MPWREESVVSQRAEFVALALQEGANVRALPTWRVVPRLTTAPTPGLLAIRMQRGLTQRMLAERSGVDRATVARLEAGTRREWIP